MKPYFKNIILSALNLIPRVRRQPRLTVLMYHSIAGDGEFFSVHPSDFDAQMSYIAGAFDVIPLSQAISYLRGEKLVRDTVAVTFDDGYMDFLQAALPVLKKYSIPATLFLSGGLVDREALGSDKPLVSPSDATLLTHPLVSLGSHAVSHRKLTRLSHEVAREEIVGSKQSIWDQYGIDPKFFAYPKGSYTPALEQVVLEAGYEGACSAVNRSVKASDRVTAIPRVQVDSRTNLPLFKLLLTSSVDRYHVVWTALSWIRHA